MVQVQLHRYCCKVSSIDMASECCQLCRPKKGLIFISTEHPSLQLKSVQMKDTQHLQHKPVNICKTEKYGGEGENLKLDQHIYKHAFKLSGCEAVSMNDLQNERRVSKGCSVLARDIQNYQKWPPGFSRS